MRPKDCAYIVEHLSVRFMAMVADHSRQLAEHRAAFGARTEADAKIIAGLREELEGVGKGEGIRKSAERLVQERDALRAEVADLRGIFDMVHASLGIKRGDHIGNAMAALKAQTPKHSHPVKVGEWVRNRDGGLAQVLEVHKDGSRIVIRDANDMGEANIYLTESGARQMATALIGLCDVRKVPQ